MHFLCCLQDDRENADLAGALKKAKLELKKSKRKDYYLILGVGQSANASDIKKAYRKKALEWSVAHCSMPPESCGVSELK